MADDFKALIKAQKETTRQLMSAEQRAEMDTVIAENQHQEKIKSDNRIEGGRKAWQTRQDNKELSAGGSAAKEDAAEKAAADKKNQGLLGKIAGGVTGMFGKMMKPVKGAGKGIMAMLKGTLVAGLLLAVVAFLESKYWTDTKKFIVDTIIPAIAKFWGYIKELGPVFKQYFVDTWKNITELFSGLGEAFDLFSKGEWWKGIKTFFSSIGTFIMEQIDTVITAVYNIIATVFGMKKTDSVFGSIWGFLTDTYDEIVFWIKLTWFNIKNAISKVFTDIKDWFVEMWTWASGGIAKGWTNVTTFITGVWDSVIEWFEGLWTWASGGIAKGWTNVTDFITGVWDSVVGWFKGLWSWGKKAGATEEGTWKGITNFITGVWDSVVGWFKGLFTWGKKAGATEEGGWSLKIFIDEAFTKVKDWVVSLFTWATAPVGPNDSWIKKTINAVVTKVQEWALSLFAWAETPGGSWITVKIKEVINLVKVWVTGLFSWASTAGQVDGKAWSLTALIDAAVLQVIGWVKSLFAWATSDEATDPADFSIKGMIKKVLKTIIKWVTDLWAWANTDEATDPAGFSISGMIKKVIKTVVGWVTGLFTWASKAGEVDGKEWSLTTMISVAVGKVITWVKGLFTWATTTGTTEEGEFSLVKLISETITKVGDWFKDLLDIDLMAIAKKIPGYKTFMRIFGSKKSEEDEILLKEAEQKGLYNKRGRMRDSDIDTSALEQGVKSGAIQKDTLEAIIKDNDLAEKDMEFMKKLVEQATTAGSLFTHDQGLYDRLDRIFPPANQLGQVMPSTGGQVMNAQRTAQMQAAGLRRGAGSSGGAPALINAPVNTINNSQNNTTVTSTELKHPSAILNKVNLAA